MYNFLFSEFLDIFIKMNDVYGPGPFKFWIGLNFTIVLMNPEDIKVSSILLVEIDLQKIMLELFQMYYINILKYS